MRRKATAAAFVAGLVAAASVGCATTSVVSVDGARTEAAAAASVAWVSLDAGRPVLLRGVDGRLLSSLGQVPSALHTWTYVLHPGPHVLWVSSVPAGVPFVPQRLRCWVVDATLLAAGERYLLRWDAQRDAAVLTAMAGDVVAVGRLVDEPLVIERACRWERQKT